MRPHLEPRLALLAIAALPFAGACAGPEGSPLAVDALQLSVVAGCIAPPSGMVNWWQGDGDATDAVGGPTGTLHGTAGFAPGMVGPAFALNGWGDYVDFGPTAGDFRADDFTVDLWVNFNTLAGEQILIERWNQYDPGAADGWTLVKLNPGDPRGGNAIFFAMSAATRFGGQGLLRTLPSITTGEWYHVAVTREGDDFRLYWNGELADEQSASIDLDADARLLLGHRGAPDTRGFYLNGLADEIEIHDRALTAAEIAGIHAAGSAGKCRPPRSVQIDVKPDSPDNTVSCKAKNGVVPVAILTTPDFDAAEVDVASVRFGRTGTEAAEAHGRGHREDVDGDGDLDLMLHFRFGDTGLGCGDGQAILTGKTSGGAAIAGSDAVRMVG